MSRVERRLAQARQVAAFLDDIGEPKYANDVRDLCRSLDATRNALSQLHKDNMELKGQHGIERQAMLTPRQREVLEWIVAYIDQHGCSPTYREIARGLGLPSTNNVWQFVQSLKERGAIDYVPARARSIRVLSRLDDVPTALLQAELTRRGSQGTL